MAIDDGYERFGGDEYLQRASAPSLWWTWLTKLIGWDGVLPILLWTTPAVLGWMIPKAEFLIELAAVFLPIAAFLIRMVVGLRMISDNHCRPALRAVQMCVFVLGVILLIFIDCMLILSHLLPPGALWQHPGDRMAFGIIFAIYFSFMALATYPGAQAKPDRRLQNGFGSPTND